MYAHVSLIDIIDRLRKIKIYNRILLAYIIAIMMAIETPASSIERKQNYPDLRQGTNSRPITIGNVEFQVYQDKTDNYLFYVLPRTLKISRDSNGKPKINVIIVRKPSREQPTTATAYGYVTMVVTIGPQMTDKIYKNLKTKLLQRNQNLQAKQNEIKILPISFKPGTAKIGFRIHDNNSNENNKHGTEIAVNAPTSLGAEIPIVIPINKEHADTISKVVKANKTDTDASVLRVSIYYEADVTFAGEPIVVKVTADKSEMHRYFQEKSRTNAGVWLFDWSRERDKIRKQLESTKILKGEIIINDKELAKKLGGYERFTNILESRMNEAIEYMANIKVARTTREAPMNKFSRKRNSDTGEVSLIFSPYYYWQYNTYLGYAVSEVNIENRVSGNYSFSAEYSESIDYPMMLLNEDVKIPRNAINIISLDNAFYVLETIRGKGLGEGNIWGAKNGQMESAVLEVLIIDKSAKSEPQRVIFNFDNSTLNSKTATFWRNARIRLSTSGLIEPVLADIKVKGKIITSSGSIIVAPKDGRSYFKVSRSTNPFSPQEVGLRDLFGIGKIDASDIYEDLITERCRGTLRVSVIQANGVATEAILRPKRAIAYFPFVLREDGGSGFEVGTTMKLMLIGRSSSDFGNSIDIQNQATVILSTSNLPENWRRHCRT